LGGVAGSWKGIDGLVVATGGLLLVGTVALLNLRLHEGAIVAVTLEGAPEQRQPAPD
jgi:hypothetical protein